MHYLLNWIYSNIILFMLIRNFQANFSRNVKLGIAFFNTSLEKMPKFNEHGYEINKNILRPEESEDMRFVANGVLKLLKDERSKTILEEDYYHYSGGYPISSMFKVINVVDKLKCVTGAGINALGHSLHLDVPRFREFAHSSIVKRIAKDILKMQAPAVASMSYIFEMQNNWANFRKDNSFIRTSPLSTKSLIFSLSDVTENEGIFIIPNSHLIEPTTFMRNPCPKKPGKACMLPGVKPQKIMKMERIPLGKGDVFAYDGNLSYKMYFFSFIK